jgi:hypothetical protein
VQRILNLLAIQDRIVGSKGFGELAKIFAAAVRILGADLAFHSGQRVQLRYASPRSQIGRRCHGAVSSFQFPVSSF